MPRLELSALAEQDVREILAWTEQRFGVVARKRYAALIKAGFRDIRRDPFRPGTRARQEIGDPFRTYHLRYSRSRSRSSEGRVGSPRHLVLYFQPSPDRVVVARVLHDMMELQLHVPGSSDEQE